MSAKNKNKSLSLFAEKLRMLRKQGVIGRVSLKRSCESTNGTKVRKTCVTHALRLSNELTTAPINHGTRILATRDQLTGNLAAPPLTICALEEEIDAILGRIKKDETLPLVERDLLAELDRLLPNEEAVIERQANQHNIVVKNSSGTHSPFVLDLTEMVDRKKREQMAKERVRVGMKKVKELRAESERLRDQRSEIRDQEIKRARERESKVEVAVKKGGEPKKQRVAETRTRYVHEHRGEHENQFTDAPFYYNWHIPLAWPRMVAVYAMICLVIVLPVKVFGHYADLEQIQSSVKERTLAAMKSFQSAAVDLSAENPADASQDFTEAGKQLEAAQFEIDKINEAFKLVINAIPRSGANIADAEAVLAAGQEAARLGERLTSLITSFVADDRDNLTEKIATLQVGLKESAESVRIINESVSSINPESVPTEYRDDFTHLQSGLSVWQNDLQQLNNLSGTLADFLGRDYKRRYLFVFQNNNEIRPTGGFLGSLALVDIDRGAITNLEIPGGGSYDLQGGLIERRISPFPLRLVNAKWELQDANWFPDFPASAEKIQWFYEKSGGPSTDGVIALNASILPKILKLTGPITLDKYGVTLTSDNVVEQIQTQVEFNYDKIENKPKAILGELAPELLNRIFALRGAKMLELLRLMKTALTEREAQLYFSNEAAEKQFSELGWTGEIKQSSRDYLMVNNANIRGYKTEPYVDQSVVVQSAIGADGKIINTITLTRTHNGSADQVFAKESNINFIRFYVPEGSRLISADGFSEIPLDRFETPAPDWQEDADLARVQGQVYVDDSTGTFVNNEFGKTVFGNWLQVDAGESKTVVLKYELPFQIEKKETGTLSKLLGSDSDGYYSFFWQKQSGAQNRTYAYALEYPAGWAVTPLTEMVGDNNKIGFENARSVDQLAAVAFE